MTYAVDVNPLVYAVNDRSPLFASARALVEKIASSDELVYVFWPVVFGFLRITTNPAALTAPLTTEDALRGISSLLNLPQVRTGGERDGFLSDLRSTVGGMSIRGPLFSDAHIVTLMRHYGVSTIYSHDRDFRKFDGIRVVDPFPA